MRRTVSIVQGLLAQFPTSGPVATIVRTVLAQYRLNDVTRGGIGSFAILIMMVHAFFTK